MQLKDAVALADASAAIQSSLRDQQKSALDSLNEAVTMAESKRHITEA